MDTQTAINEAEAVATMALPFMPPNVSLAVGIAMKALEAVQAANASGADLTDADVQALFDLDAHARAADLAAQASILAGDPLPTLPKT